MGHRVLEILTADGRAVGVRALDRTGPEPVEVEFTAPLVMSDAGAELTFNHMLPTSGTVGELTATRRAELAAVTPVSSAVTLYLKLKVPPSSLGAGQENLWLSESWEPVDLAEQGAAILAGRPKHGFLSFPSAKAGEDRWHTAEVIALLPADSFAAWAGTTRGQRGADYEELKERISDGLLALADRAVPGLAEAVEYRELGTPLTFEHYAGQPQGRFYGLAGTPDRYRSDQVGVTTGVDGLLLAGTDALGLGVIGALLGGIAAGTKALGPTGFPSLAKASRKLAPTAPPEGAHNQLVRRHRVVLAASTALSPTVRRLDFDLAEPFSFRPGQYLRLRVAPLEWRDYSILRAAGDRLSLLVSTRTGGDGSAFAATAPVGTVTAVEGPLGSFGLQRGRPAVFIATGTGLAPLLPMFEELRAAGELDRALLLFGCRDSSEDLTAGLDVLPRTLVCCSREAGVGPGRRPGRVTDALSELEIDPEADYYLCGGAAMVRECAAWLTAAGVKRVHSEAF